MSVWVMHQALTPEEEAGILQRPYVLLPFDGIPDLSHVGSPQALRRMLQTLHPDAPPESITGIQERVWLQFTGFQTGDVVVVPLQKNAQVAIGEISGPYAYHLGERGHDEHRVAVTWHPQLLPQSAFGKHKDVFIPGVSKMVEITNKDTRIKIYDKLPHSYNRFAKWKWLMAGIIVLQAIAMLSGMLRH